MLLLFDIVVIISHIAVESAAGQIKDSGGCLIDKITVMGDIKDSPRIILKRFLKNLPGLDVQMIRRLIQNKEIGVGEHEFCHRYTAPLTAAQCFDRLKNIIPRKEKGGENISDSCII